MNANIVNYPQKSEFVYLRISKHRRSRNFHILIKSFANRKNTKANQTWFFKKTLRINKFSIKQPKYCIIHN